MCRNIRKELKRLMKIYHELHRRDRKTKIFYLHIPKCGGNSIDSAFRRHFRPNSAFKENTSAIIKGGLTHFEAIADEQQLTIENNCYFQNYREAILLYSMYCDQFSYISGHFSFNEHLYELFMDQYHFVTILRNPEKRFISEYSYNKHRQRSYHSISDDLSSFIDSPRGREYGVKYVKLLGGLDEGADYHSKEAIERAKVNLRKFHVIGILEDLDLFIRQIKDKLDIKLKIGHKNKSPAKASVIQDELTDENLERIRLLCRPDTEVYRFALDIYDR